MAIFKFNYWTLFVKIGKYDLSKLNVNNLQEYWTVTEKSRFKTKKSVKKSVNNRFTTDFRLFCLKNYTKKCGAARTRIILFTLIMDRIKRRKIDFWLWCWHDNEDGHGSSLIIDLLFFRIKILFWPMPFVNHDSDKSKYRDRIFFPENFREKT
jgi:hypothetical protein